MTGQTLGRYQVVEQIGAGGMGEVYRAYDPHLERDVALKILPPGLLADDAARKRFRREALALSKLNHPNIATVFDFDSHGGVDFLAMELIHGTPLSVRLRTEPLQEGEVCRLGIQLAEGLAAAHACGVIHRDLKPGNLMVTPDGRLKILDFGLAILTHAEGPQGDVTRSLTGAPTIAGTLPYMSPEQLRGLPLDARSDIYAVGTVLYEMATGRPSFPHYQSAELIGAILHQLPTPPKTVVPRLTPALQSVVMKALHKEPAQRHQSASELAIALEGVRDGGEAATEVNARPARVTVGVAIAVTVALAALILGLNVGGLRERMWHRGSAAGNAAGSPTTGHVRRSVAVLGFKNLSGRPEQAWLSTALSEMLTTELAAGEQLRTIPGESVFQMKINLALADADSYGRETLAKIRSNLGSDHVVLGSYVPLGGQQIRLDLRMQDAVTGDILSAISEKGDETNIDDLVGRAGTKLRAKLGVGDVTAAEAAGVKAALPSNSEAVRLYTIGLTKLRVFDALAARDLLEKAVAADPDYSLAHSALATAWSSLGYDEKARAEARKSFELSAKLSREDRLWVEGRYRETTREMPKAVEIYRTLWSFFPDNVDYGLRLVAAQISAGSARDALTTIDALRALPAPASADPRIDLGEANAAESLSDFTRSLAAAERAAASGSLHGARLLIAQAQIAQGSALVSLGEMEKATRIYESAREILLSAGDRGNAASASRAIGLILLERGDLSKAEEVFKQALGIWREIGDQRQVAVTLSSLAGVRYRQDDFPAAKTLYEEALENYRRINDRRGVGGALNGVGVVLVDQGEFAAGKKAYEEALAIFREIGQKDGVAREFNNLALVLTRESDLSGARRMFEEALTLRREIADKGGVASTLRGLSEVHFRQGDLPGARKQAEEALATQITIGQKEQAAFTRKLLASILIAEGQAPRAEALALEASEELRTEKAVVEEADGRRVLAESHLAQGHLAEARNAIATATKLLGTSANPDVRFPLLIAAARIRAASGETAQAVKGLEAVRSEALKANLIEAEFESRLALGEIDMRSANPTAARARLAALENDATRKGFLLIARKAHAAASGQVRR